MNLVSTRLTDWDKVLIRRSGHGNAEYRHKFRKIRDIFQEDISEATCMEEHLKFSA